LLIYILKKQNLNLEKIFCIIYRYSRREGFFKKLEKEKNKPNEYGKQLVFQFSDKVVKDLDWKWSFSKK